MMRRRARGRRLQAQVVAQIVTARIVAEPPLASAEFETRLDGVALSAVNFEVVLIRAAIDTAVFGVDIDDSFVAISDLGRQHAGEQRNAVHEAWAENLAEAGDRFREEDIVEPIMDDA